MATLHNEFIQFNKKIKLTNSRKESLKKSRKSIRKKIRSWFKENKPNELQPKFSGQGSFEMNTTINPIPEYDKDENKLLKYDLDDGIYFLEKDDEDNKKAVNTWHDWVYTAVNDHTIQETKKKKSCIRVIFSDGHHIDLPIYYEKDDVYELAHKSEGFITSDPKEFYDWFNGEKNPQLERIVRYLKAWRNFRENKNTNLKLPSGFELTILATNDYSKDDNDDTAFRETVRNIYDTLSVEGGFKCLRPTTPKDENVFEDYSETRKDNFLNTLKSLLSDCDRANEEKNLKKASEYLINNQFGSRFPKGEDTEEEVKSSVLDKSLSATIIKPKPYGK